MLMKRSSGSVSKGVPGSLLTRARGFHSSAQREQREQDDEEDEDNPWGDLDRAFENLQDKSLYKQIYHSHAGRGAATPVSDRAAPASSPAKDPIAEMEEAIFAQAGAAAVRSAAQPPRKMATGALSGVSFSKLPPSAAAGVPMAAGSVPHNFGLDGSLPGASAKWSEYMQNDGSDDDSPWASLDAFVDNPESSAQFAVPLHLQQQQNIMQMSAQQHVAPSFSQSQPLQHDQPVHTVGEAFAANDDLLRQQMQLQSDQASSAEEDAFARAGAAAVAQLLNTSAQPSPVDAEDSDQLSHIDPATGGASMVDVSHKPPTSRSATAVGRVYLPTSICHLLLTTEPHQGISNKGPVLHTAQLAGIMAAKRTSDLIPLCHPLPLTHVEVKLEVQQQGGGGELGEGRV